MFEYCVKLLCLNMVCVLENAFNVGVQQLVGGFKHFLFSPLFGEMIQFDEHIFQMG